MWPWKTKKPVEELIDFEKTIDQLRKLSPKAQTTFLYRLIEVLPSRVVKTLQFYVARRLNNGKSDNVGQNQLHTTAKSDNELARGW